MHGKVHVWYMTKEELADYVKKHPIQPTEKPKGTSYEEIHAMQYKKSARDKNEHGHPWRDKWIKK